MSDLDAPGGIFSSAQSRLMGRVPLFIKLCIFRVVNALLVQTFFQPDEFYQSLEVAHRLVFGYGWETWEWRADAAIRSPLHPLIFVPGYWLVKEVGLDGTEALVYAPKIVQGIIAAINDYYTARLASKLFGSRVHAEVALFCSLASFFNGGVTVRTFSNSLETAITAAALSKWTWTSRSGYGASLRLAGLACIVRPTNTIIWFFLAAHAILRGRSFTIRLLKTGLLPLIGCATLCFALDTWYYGFQTFTPLNFYRTNVANKISVFYGANPWHFYGTQAIPFDMLALLPFLLHGIYLTFARTPVPGLNLARNSCIWTISVLSLISHKEFRFIQPLLPIFHVLTAHSLVKLAHLSQETAARSRLIPHLRRSHVALILAVNIPATVFFILIHLRGQVSVISYLHQLPAREVQSIGFLMPCHSAPWQSHLHRPELEILDEAAGKRAWALSCEPPLGRNPLTYQDETALFYQDPHAFIREYLSDNTTTLLPDAAHAPVGTSRYSWPSHLLVFDELLHRSDPKSGQSFESLTREKGYVEQKRIWNSFWHEEPKRAGDIVVLWHSSSL